MSLLGTGTSTQPIVVTTAGQVPHSASGEAVIVTSSGQVIRTASGQVLSGVRQTKITDHVSHLPPYLQQQMYAGEKQ